MANHTGIVVCLIFIIIIGCGSSLEKIYHRMEDTAGTDIEEFLKVGGDYDKVLEELRTGLQKYSKFLYLDVIFEFFKVGLLFLLRLIGDHNT